MKCILVRRFTLVIGFLCWVNCAFGVGGETAAEATLIGPGDLPYCDEATTAGKADDHSPYCVSADGPDVWYKYTLPVDMVLMVSLCGSSYNTVLDVWAVSPDLADTVNPCCNDNSEFCNLLQSCCTLYLVGGSQCFICVDGFSGLFGDYIIWVLEVPGGGVDCPELPCTAHPEDECVSVIDPETVPGGVGGSLAGAQDDGGIPDCGVPMSGPGVWYSVIGTGHVMSATTCNPTTDFNTQLHVYCGECANLVCV